MNLFIKCLLCKNEDPHCHLWLSFRISLISHMLPESFPDGLTGTCHLLELSPFSASSFSGTLDTS